MIWIAVLAFLATSHVQGSSNVYVRGAIEFTGAFGTATEFPAEQAIGLADEMINLFNTTASTSKANILSVEVEAADLISEKANAILILFSVEGKTPTDANVILAALQVPIQGEITGSDYVDLLTLNLRQHSAFSRSQEMMSLEISTTIALETFADDTLPPLPPPPPASAPVRQKEVVYESDNATKSDQEKKEDLDTSTEITVAVAGGSGVIVLLVIGLVVAKMKANKAAAARMAADKEPLLKFLPGTLNQTQECLEHIFKEYDGDGSLEIDSSELRALIDEQLIAHGILLDDSDMEQRDINIIMRALDVDGDKTLSMDEFVRYEEERKKTHMNFLFCLDN